tara:strand:- start:751 stop:1032 length:282 start_codon:yes stop_codon:yes gene_type:complete
MGGIFSTPKPPPPPDTSEEDARRKKQLEAQEAKERKSLVARRRAKQTGGPRALMTQTRVASAVGNQNQFGEATDLGGVQIGAGRNPRKGNDVI